MMDFTLHTKLLPRLITQVLQVGIIKCLERWNLNKERKALDWAGSTLSCISFSTDFEQGKCNIFQYMLDTPVEIMTQKNAVSALTFSTVNNKKDPKLAYDVCL